MVRGNLSAGNTLALDSAGDILLEAGKAHLQDKSKSNNAGAEVGVGVSVGAQTGVYVYAEASVGSSKSNSDSSTWQNTTLTGQNISLKAEGDTTLRGATATADRIDVKTGGTLTIESLQDIAESMSKDSQVGGRVQVSLGTAWDASGYASASKANGSYKGVGQQSGLFAGDGGYHVDAGHVNLVGGAIASTNAANSELTAQTLTFAGPGTDGKGLAGNGVVSYLSIMTFSLGYVTHLIDPSTSSLINITVPGAHALDPGFVIRQIVPDGHGGFSVSTRGWGTGSSPLSNSNSWADDFVWAPNTRDIGEQVSEFQWPWSEFPSKQKCMSTRDSQGKLVEVCQ